MNKLYEISLSAKSQITEVPITKETNRLLYIGENTDCRSTIRKDELMTIVGRHGLKSVFCYEEHLNEAITTLLEYETAKVNGLRECITKQEENMAKLRSQKTEWKPHNECVQMDYRTGRPALTIKIDYEHKIKSGVLVIHDLDLGNKSVTYSMETVLNALKEIRDSDSSFDDIPIICKARDGIFDEIKPEKGSIRIIPLETADEDEAIQWVKNRGIFYNRIKL